MVWHLNEQKGELKENFGFSGTHIFQVFVLNFITRESLDGR